MAKLQGFFLCGILEGFASTPWTNDASKFNHRLGISRVFEDEWGNESRETVRVDVPLQSVEMMRKQAEMLKGKAVMVRVVPQARQGGKTGVWLSVFVPQGENLVPQNAADRTQAA